MDRLRRIVVGLLLPDVAGDRQGRGSAGRGPDARRVRAGHGRHRPRGGHRGRVAREQADLVLRRRREQHLVAPTERRRRPVLAVRGAQLYGGLESSSRRPPVPLPRVRRPGVWPHRQLPAPSTGTGLNPGRRDIPTDSGSGARRTPAASPERPVDREPAPSAAPSDRRRLGSGPGPDPAGMKAGGDRRPGDVPVSRRTSFEHRR